MELTLSYGRHGLQTTLPDRNVRHVLRMNELPVLPDPERAVREALAAPIASPPLADLVRDRRDAVIVVSDLTRPVPNALLLPPLLETLRQAGLLPERVTILVATGLHRGNTETELAEMLGPQVLASGCRIVNHMARDAESHTDLGRTPRGMPVRVDRRYVEADLKILTGLIEPHLMAGYSGGRKAICPGLCSVETVLSWHSAEMLDPDEARAGNLWRNPVHEEALRVADMANALTPRPPLPGGEGGNGNGPDALLPSPGDRRSHGRGAGGEGSVFLLNVVLNEARQLTGVFAGEMRQAHLAGMEVAERQTKVVLAEPVDIVVTTSAGYPLDLTFYQGVKGMVGALPIVKPGGSIIVAQENAEGLGGPEFCELILGQHSLDDFMAAAFGGEPCRIDQWQLQEMHKVCRHATVYSVSSLPPEVQRESFVEPAESVEAAVAQALAVHGPDASIAVIPEGPYVLACLQDDLVGMRNVREMT